MRQLARFKISFYFLEQVLDLPKNVNIVKVYADQDSIHESQAFWLMVEGEPFDEVPEGTEIPEICPTVLNREPLAKPKWEWNNESAN